MSGYCQFQIERAFHPKRSIFSDRFLLMSYTIAMNNTSCQHIREKQTAPSLMVSLGIWFAIFCWGGAYVAARFLLHPVTAASIALSPLQLATLRFGIASLFFIIPLAQAIIHRQIPV